MRQVRIRIYSARCVSALTGLVTLTFDLETNMQVASGMGNLHSEFGHARIWVLELFAMYATGGQTVKSNAYCPLPYMRGITKHFILHNR